MSWNRPRTEPSAMTCASSVGSADTNMTRLWEEPRCFPSCSQEFIRAAVGRCGCCAAPGPRVRVRIPGCQASGGVSIQPPSRADVEASDVDTVMTIVTCRISAWTRFIGDAAGHRHPITYASHSYGSIASAQHDLHVQISRHFPPAFVPRVSRNQ